MRPKLTPAQKAEQEWVDKLQTSWDAYLEAHNFARDPGTVAMAMGRWLIQQIARIEARLEAIERMRKER